jgi:hypothetical protein
MLWLSLTPQAHAALIRLSEEGFFHALDLARPDLAEVRAAVDQANWPLARAKFVAHVKTREQPRWYVNWRDRPEQPPRHISRSMDRQTADDALQQRFTSCGISWRFSGGIDWSFNPTALPDSGYALNHEWTWGFNRHEFWPCLGRAYWETGDERYVEEFVRQMTDWVATNPAPELKANQMPYSRWRTIEAGIRMGSAWPQAFYLCLSSPNFTDDAICAMVRSMAEHARYLKAHPTQNNWLTMEMSGLYTVGTLFSEFKEAADWRQFAAERMRRELDTQVYPDGAQKELAPGYHEVALNNFCMIVRLADLNNAPVPDGYRDRLERMFAYLMWLMTPDRGYPPFNDSADHSGELITEFKDAFKYFPHRADFQWIASNGKAGTAPAPTSYAFSYAGYAIQRSGWDPTARFLAFDGGPFGAGHQHEDKLNFIIKAYARELLVEGRNYPYDTSKWRKYVVSPYAHNVAFVDGQGQQRAGVTQTYVTDAPLPLAWQSTDAYDCVRAAYGGEYEGFGHNPVWAATHVRRVVFVKRGPAHDAEVGDFWIVADTFLPQDSGPHKYETVFHLDAPDAAVDSGTHSVRTQRASGPNLGIFPMPVNGLGLQVIKGQEEPFIQGWIPIENATQTGVRPIPTPVFKVEGAGVRHLLYVFYPVPAPPVPEVTVTPWNPEGIPADKGVMARISFSNGPKYCVFFPTDPDKSWSIDKKPFHGEVWLAIAAGDAWKPVAS